MVNNKLIRLHTETDDGIFDCIFKDEITVSPNSEIALQSCALSRSMEVLVIDATNDLIKYQIQANQGELQIRLKHGEYTRLNILELFQDLQDKINKKLDVNQTKNNGTQFSATIDRREKALFEFAYSGIFNWSSNAAGAGIDLKNINTASNELKRTVATASTNLNDAAIWGRVPFIKGAGVFRARLKQYVAQANGGLVMGLISQENYSKITAGTLTEADIYFGLKVPADPAQELQTILNGVSTGSGETLVRFAAGGGVNNDVLEIQLDEGNLYAMLHTTNPGDVNQSVTKTLSDTDGEPLDPSRDYYCFMSLLSGSNNLRVDRCGHMPDPYEQVPPALTDSAFLTENELGAPAPPSFSAADTVYNFIFQTFDVADYLGFKNVELNRNNEASTVGIFQANRNLKNVVVSDSYLIELLNLPLDSYDSLTNGRKNILASIPISERILTNTGIIQYEPNTLFFIDLKNDFPLTLRNIRARIVTDDFQEIITEGLSTISIIVRGKK